MTHHTRSFAPAASRRAVASVLLRSISPLLLAGASACAPVQSGAIDTSVRPQVVDTAASPRFDDPSSAHEALARMNERWGSEWFNTALVRMEVTLLGLGAPAPGEWAQTIRVPGRARVDYLPMESNSGVLYTPGTVYGFQEGERAATENRTDLAMVALADLPALHPDSALARLTDARVDTSLFRVSEDGGARVWVIGGGSNDSLRSQVWIDAERLLVRRAVEVRPVGQRTITTEARVLSWREQDGLTLPDVLERWREGTRVSHQRWAAVAIDVALPINLFDPDQWTRVRPPAPPAIRRP